MPLSAGDKLGPSEILAPIEAGGKGEMWKALDTQLGSTVALTCVMRKISREPCQTVIISNLNSHPPDSLWIQGAEAI